jgi:hypothetical protein
MFGIFSKKKRPQSAIDEFIFAIYGNPPPPKRANVGQAISLACELLMGIVDEKEVSHQATSLSDGPIPYSTHDLAVSVALHFFKQTEFVPRLSMAQLLARMKVLEWHQAGFVVPVLIESFEDALYKLYKPSHQ